MAVMAPMTLFSLLAGIIFVIRPIKKLASPGQGGLTWRGIRAFLWEIMPILIVVMTILILAALTGLLNLLGFSIEIPGALSILPGLVAAMAWVCRINHVSRLKIRAAVLDKSILPMVFLLLAIMVFKGTMIESRAVVAIRNELIAYHIPVVLVVMMMPFISGLITGVAIGFVGTSFPLIIPMFPPTPLIDYLSYAALAYTFGYMGMMLSPVHLCFLVTKDYYHANLLKSYRHLIMPALTIMATITILFFISMAL